MFKEPHIFSYGVITQQQREQIYNDVWSEPIKTAAMKYGISEATLKKYCTKFGVPLPPRGYWNETKKDVQSHKRNLPKVTGDLKKRIRNYIIQYQPNWKEFSDEELRDGEGIFLLSDDTKTYLHDVCTNIDVKNQLRKPHLLIIEHQEEIAYRKKRDREIAQASYSLSAKWEVEKQHRKNKAVLPIQVSSEHLKRAYRIIDALIKTLENLEGHISVSSNWQTQEDAASITILDRHFTFEFTNNAQKKKNPVNKNPATSTEPLKMSFTTSTYWKNNHSETLKFIDSNQNPLEKQLPRIILDLFNTATKVTALDEIAHREIERKWAEDERKHQFEKLQEQENKRLEALQAFMKDWEYAKNLRRFAAELEEGLKEEVEGDNQLIDLVSWIQQKANWFDPTICATDPLLGQRHQPDEILKKLNLLK